jgi:hypothetical protein
MRENPHKASWLLIASAAICNCVAQLWWFSGKSLHEIDFDGMGYVGIAKHIVDGHFRESINAFRSPLISWLIAMMASPDSNLVLIGKFVSMGSTLVCAGLVFVFAYALWRSREVAAVAMLWFSFSRGLFPLSAAFVTPDVLFAIFVLLYFIVLIRCLERRTKLDWFLLGAVHALAYLAKAFALPWLAVSTLVASALTFKKPRWKQVGSVSLAICMPIAVALAWGSFLHSKYGVFTTGTQLKANLLQWTLDVHLSPSNKEYEILRDMSPFVDRYGVVDPMPPGSSAWGYPIHFTRLLPAIAKSEGRYLPAAFKELLVVLTVGGAAAFLLGFFVLFRNRNDYPTEFRVMTLVGVDSVILVLTYCMLVFDGRYIFPILPILMASTAPFLVWRADATPLALPALWHRVIVILVVAGIAFTLVYRSSPYRTITRDYQESCYNAGRLLRQAQGQTIVSFGIGPYPEHGVGWEAGYKSAFFGSKQLVGFSPNLPSDTGAVIRDIQRSAAESVLVWGAPTSYSFVSLVGALRASCPGFTSEPIDDEAVGQVGQLFTVTIASSLTINQRISTPSCALK